MSRTILNATTLSFTLFATIFLVKSGLSLSLKDIAELSTAKRGYNSKVVKNLCNQRVDTWFGFIFLLCSFVMQMVNLLLPTRWIDFDVNTKWFLISFAIIFILLMPNFLVAKFISGKAQVKVKDIFSTM